MGDRGNPDRKGGRTQYEIREERAKSRAKGGGKGAGSKSAGKKNDLTVNKARAPFIQAMLDRVSVSGGKEEGAKGSRKGRKGAPDGNSDDDDEYDIENALVMDAVTGEYVTKEEVVKMQKKRKKEEEREKKRAEEEIKMAVINSGQQPKSCFFEFKTKKRLRPDEEEEEKKAKAEAEAAASEAVASEGKKEGEISESMAKLKKAIRKAALDGLCMLGSKREAVFFAELTGNTGKMTQDHYKMFLRRLGISHDPESMWQETTKRIGSEVSSISMDQFFFFVLNADTAQHVGQVSIQEKARQREEEERKVEEAIQEKKRQREREADIQREKVKAREKQSLRMSFDDEEEEEEEVEF